MDLMLMWYYEMLIVQQITFAPIHFTQCSVCVIDLKGFKMGSFCTVIKKQMDMVSWSHKVWPGGLRKQDVSDMYVLVPITWDHACAQVLKCQSLLSFKDWMVWIFKPILLYVGRCTSLTIEATHNWFTWYLKPFFKLYLNIDCWQLISCSAVVTFFIFLTERLYQLSDSRLLHSHP